MPRWLISLPLLLCLFATGTASATEEYADLSGQECETCHLDPDGGGPLTYVGEAYADHEHLWPPAGEQPPPRPGAGLSGSCWG